MPVCLCEHHEDACVAGIPPIGHVMSGGCVELGLNVEDSNSIDFSTTGGLDLVAKVSADAFNVVDVTANGIRALEQFVGTRSASNNFVVNTEAVNIQQTATLTLPSGGDWFVHAWWSAWCEKNDLEVSDAGAVLQWQIEIAGSAGAVHNWEWGATEGLLGHARSRIVLTDTRGIDVAGNQTFNVSIRMGRSPAGTENSVAVNNSRVIVLATKLNT